MDSQNRFDETFLHDKVDFYSNLSIEGIADADYKHAKAKNEAKNDFEKMNFKANEQFLEKLWTQSLMLYLMLTFLDTLNLVQSMGECLNE